MAFNFNRYDQSKIREGQWEDIEGGRFLIAKSGNSRHLEVSERLGKELKRKYSNGDVPILVRLETTAREWAEAVLLGWSGVEAIDPDTGKASAVPYSIENAIALLMSDEPLFNSIRQKSTEMARFEAEHKEEQAKKPKASSAGKASSSEEASP